MDFSGAYAQGKLVAINQQAVFLNNDTDELKTLLHCEFPSNDKHDKLMWLFIRGYYDHSDTPILHYPNGSFDCMLTSHSKEFLQKAIEFIRIPSQGIEYDDVKKTYIATFCDVNAIDFLGKIYNDSTCLHLRSEEKYERYVNLLKRKPFDTNASLPKCYVHKTDADAVLPSKANVSDAGYDLTVINVVNKWLNNVTLYDTGIKILMNPGYYAEIVPRSSLSKSGYMLANSVGVIDNTYRGNLYIALVKVDPSAPDIKLPFRCCQLIFRKQEHMDIVETEQDLGSTMRQEGGFGSTSL
jgi:deoxyuridine 5'-triphosphate nucleotidohydrolase